MKILLILCVTLAITNSINGRVFDEVFRVPLDGNGSVILNWVLEYSKELIWFEVHLPLDFGWFALGFSDRGELYPADYCVLWKDWKNTFHYQDAWAAEDGVLFLDSQQDCLNFKMKYSDNVLKFLFSRKFDTCDINDYIIEDGTVHLVWSKGHEKLHHLEGLNVSSSQNGMTRTQLLKNVQMRAEEEGEKLEILVDKVKVPGEETTYWCHVHKLPEAFKRKHHILQYEPLIEERNQGIVHHMEVFHCVAPVDQEIPDFAGSCFAEDRPPATQVCKRVLAAWAMGAKAFIYPEEAALPIGGEDFNPYIMLEVHYNNVEKRKDIIDSSGILFHITSELRSMDAGVIELGLEYTDKMGIPPDQNSFSLTGYCVSECTAVSLPPEGITIFGSQLHTHLTGIRVVTRHFRDGIELAELNRDDHYSTHFQEIRRLKRFVRILPGDALLTTCDYRTEDRKNITLGGFAISDEMCVNYIHYFPAIDLEVCKSAISDQALNTYFQYMKEWENQDTKPNESISSNYHSIVWNKMRVQHLKDFYAEAPLSMQCNMSSGDRFPGYWENTPLTPILKPLPPPVRHCLNTK